MMILGRASIDEFRSSIRMEVLSCFRSSSSLTHASLRYRGPLAFPRNNSVVNVVPRRPLNKYMGISCTMHHRKIEFCGHSYDINSQKRRHLPRNIVARSELAGTESHDAAYALTGFQLGSKVRGVCFYSVTSVIAIVLFVLMLVSHPFVLLFDRYRRKAHHLIAKIWSTLTVLPFFDVQFEGLENLPTPDTPAVYVSNHQSFLDIFTLLMLGRNFKFISKTGIFVFPIIGWAMYFLGTIPLKRMDSRSQLDCLKRCMDLLRKGSSVFFFPEGTRSKDGKLGVFKKGAFSVAAKTGVPVIPITLIGTGKLMPVGKEVSLNSGSVKVIIHKPLEGNNADILCEKARKAIADDLSLHG